MRRFLERDAEILRRREAGETLKAIGWSYDPPISRERVRQIVAKELRIRANRARLTTVGNEAAN